MNVKIDGAFLVHASDILGDTNSGLSGSQIIKYCITYANDFGVAIPICSADFSQYGSKIPNKRTALLLNLQAFDSQQQFRIIKDLCDLPLFKDNEDVKGLKSKLFSRYGMLSAEKISNTELVQKTKHWLANYTAALKQYDSALMKYESGIFERNTLDDMRLSFELLVKDLLDNDKSLENQLSDLGYMLKSKGASEELKNMVVKIIDYYTKFQNHHVKHNDLVNGSEIEYVIELTSVIMKFLIKINGGCR